MSGRERRSLASNMYEQLTDDNFLLYCAKRYDNSEQITTDEFIEELDRIKYIKKLVTRFNETGELRERLILNHIITLANCFGQYTAKILFLKTEKQYSFVKPSTLTFVCGIAFCFTPFKIRYNLSPSSEKMVITPCA